MSTAVELYYSLRLCGVAFTLTGDNLSIEAPPGLITDDVREQLRANKLDLIAALLRRAEVMSRVDEAKNLFEARAPGRVNWGTETAECEEAYKVLGEAMYNYVAGTQPIEEVASACRVWISTFEEVKCEAEVV